MAWIGELESGFFTAIGRVRYSRRAEVPYSKRQQNRQFDLLSPLRIKQRCHIVCFVYVHSSIKG